MRAETIILTSLIIAVPAAAQAPAVKSAPEAAVKVELLPTEIDAVGWAFDALSRPAEQGGYSDTDRKYIRFVWVPPYGDPEWIGLVDFAVNAACGQGATKIKADRHAGGWLLAYDLRKFAPDPAQLIKLIDTWDSLAERDSKLHVPRINQIEVIEEVTVTDPRTRQPTKQKKTVKRDKRVFVFPPHMEAALARHITQPEKSQRLDDIVSQLTKSSGAIYPADFLIEQLITSLRGKYPEFRQIEFKSDNKNTPLQNHFAKHGFFFEESSKRISGLRGVLLLYSEITGKTRIMVTFTGVSGRRAYMTLDFKDNRVRPDEQFIRNLLEFLALSQASEIFIELPNGLLEYVLADDKGNILRAAPPDVVADDTKPPGHTKELEMGMSCVLCHSPNDGYNTKKNDMDLFLGSDSDFFGDVTAITVKSALGLGPKVTYAKQEALDIVVGAFGQPIYLADGIIGRSRRDFTQAVNFLTEYKIQATDGAIGSSPVQQLGAKMKAVYHTYRYPKIDADYVCMQLGVRVPPGQTVTQDGKRVSLGLATLRKLVPPLPRGQVEDPLIPLLRNGAVIKRDDYDPLHAELARRALDNRELFIEENAVAKEKQ